MNIRLLFFALFYLWAGTKGLKAQRHWSNDREDFEQLIENLLPVQEERVNYNDLYDRLFSLYAHHMNLNEAGMEDLQMLYILSDDQINNLLAYRKKYGPFFTKYELVTIDGFDRETVEQLLSFADIKPPGNSSSRFFGKWPGPDRNDLLIRAGRMAGISVGFVTTDSLKRFQGGPWQTMLRYTLARRGAYSFGVTIEQDPGEKIIWQPRVKRYGMDYWSFHAMIENRGIIKKFIVGDFTIETGQGLLFGSGFRMGKGSDAILGIRRNSPGLKPYRSVFEYRDFSGAALTLEAGHFSLTCFGSLAGRDAVVYSDTLTGEDPYISYIRNTGLHRNYEELKTKHAMTEKAAGMNFQFTALNGKIIAGFNGVKTFYSRPVVPVPGKYNRFRFSGPENASGSLYANLSFRNLSIFGEAGASEGGGKGMVGGFVANLSSYAALSVLYRNYGRTFYALHGNAFGEDLRNNNEEGLYIGVKITPVRRVYFSFYFDRYYFSWLRYRADGPSGGYEVMALADYKPDETWSFRMIYRAKMRELNGYKEQENVHRLEPALKQWLRLDAGWHPAGILSLRTRVMMKSYRFCRRLSYGYLVAEDILLNGNRFFSRGRVSYFNTDDYNTRQFIYEQDLLYRYAVPFFYGKGWRYYFVGGWYLGKKWTLWMKVAQTRYTDRQETGSGMDKIPGNVRTELRIQIRVKF